MAFTIFEQLTQNPGREGQDSSGYHWRAMARNEGMKMFPDLCRYRHVGGTNPSAVDFLHGRQLAHGAGGEHLVSVVELC